MAEQIQNDAARRKTKLQEAVDLANAEIGARTGDFGAVKLVGKSIIVKPTKREK